MSDIKEKVASTIEKYNLINNRDKIILGVSGGPDSICMLNVLKQISEEKKQSCNLNQKQKVSFEIVVAHVNHMIRAEADGDEEFVRNYCKKNNIDFYSKSIDVRKLANNSKIGIEEAGRIARYDFFDEVMRKTNANKVAIAHNMNDRAETVIMNLLRGSGVSGLIGIEAKRGIYIRPLIECDRFEIEEYCDSNNLNPRIDKTNFDNTYTRNKIRNVVIPYIKEEFNPNIINTLNRLSDLACDEEEFVENQVKDKYKELLCNENKKEIILDLKGFNNQEKVIKSRIILYTITRLFGTSKGIEKIHIEDIIKLCSNNIGNKYLTPNKKIKVLVKNHKIYFISQI